MGFASELFLLELTNSRARFFAKMSSIDYAGLSSSSLNGSTLICTLYRYDDGG